MNLSELRESDPSIEARARRAARRIGLVARKSRWRKNSIDNFSDFMLIEPTSNAVMAGSRFELTANEVIEYCKAIADRR
jgi:hypothetical protein